MASDKPLGLTMPALGDDAIMATQAMLDACLKLVDDLQLGEIANHVSMARDRFVEIYGHEKLATAVEADRSAG